jgi:hypothetical protein
LPRIATAMRVATQQFDFASETLSFRRPPVLCANEHMALRARKLGSRVLHTGKIRSRKCFICGLARRRSLFPDLKRIQQVIHARMCGFAGATRLVSADESGPLFNGLFIDETLFAAGRARKPPSMCARFPPRKSSCRNARGRPGHCAVYAGVLSSMKRFFGMLTKHVDGLQCFPCRQKGGIALAQTSLMGCPR